MRRPMKSKTGHQKKPPTKRDGWDARAHGNLPDQQSPLTGLADDRILTGVEIMASAAKPLEAQSHETGLPY